MDITNEKLLKQVIENVKSEVEKLEVIRQNISDELYRYDEASLANQNNETIFDELQQKTDESYIHVDESMQSLNNIVKNLGTTLELNEKIKASEKQYGKKEIGEIESEMNSYYVTVTEAGYSFDVIYAENSDDLAREIESVNSLDHFDAVPLKDALDNDIHVNMNNTVRSDQLSKLINEYVYVKESNQNNLETYQEEELQEDQQMTL
ncbi:hypothetical protein [Enterococcus termitis]|uniref:Uncharacterized protein n=1 Tax=Enterococcus termitis TaxID=332950 RepID=A0A1E5H105_9ENTE|nr:hypothetical protein [Enterococcus termitis]OEG18678.1 hypothetical protein BCR25_15880 [Enterococcus termitis]OJG97597.1 hypothetical protein RV18_GL000665 [Enterococcus termitis]